MKQHLKFLLLSTLTTIPAFSVVACASTSGTEVSNQDVLNSAEGRMQFHIFNQTDLNLTAIPENGISYDNWQEEQAKNLINDYYSELVTSGNLEWPYETVSVNIRSSTTEELPSVFLNKYGDAVEARIDLVADLSFKDLTSSVPIVVKINNNTSQPKERINKIADYLKNYLDQERTDPFEFKTLFKNGLTNKDSEANNVYGQITSSLKAALFTKTNSQPIPVIDVEGVNFEVLSIARDAPEVSLYILNSSAFADDSINGTLQNLTLQISNSGYAADIKLSDLTNKGGKLAIRQSHVDTSNQIAGILNQNTLQFEDTDLPNSKLPDNGQALSSYDTEGKLTTELKTRLFSLISTIYPSANMGAAWSADKVLELVSPGSAQFVLESSEGDPVQYGYFLVTVEFKCEIAPGVIIQASQSDLKLQLTTKTAS